MRELARLLLCVKQKSNGKISTLSDAVKVSNFDILLSCVRYIANFDNQTHPFVLKGCSITNTINLSAWAGYLGWVSLYL